MEVHRRQVLQIGAVASLLGVFAIGSRYSVTAQDFLADIRTDLDGVKEDTVNILGILDRYRSSENLPGKADRAAIVALSDSAAQRIERIQSSTELFFNKLPDDDPRKNLGYQFDHQKGFLKLTGLEALAKTNGRNSARVGFSDFHRDTLEQQFKEIETEIATPDSLLGLNDKLKHLYGALRTLRYNVAPAT